VVCRQKSVFLHSESVDDMIILQIVFWFCVCCVFHSYVFYPLLLRIVATRKPNNQEVFEQQAENLPVVSFLMSLYNEQAVINEKMQSLLQTQYPTHKWQVFIGSDCSDDATDTLVQKYADQAANVHFFPFEKRRGKPSVINDLAAKAMQQNGTASQHILIISDANVLLTAATVYQLVKHFKNPTIGLVDSNILPPHKAQLGKEGIAALEKQYISGEVYLKHLEGKAWGRTMGPLGGCYAFRAQHFRPIPANYLVDDFYVAMRVFEQGGKAINELKAVCYESVPNNIAEEFRRKARISAGNFTNLATFKHLLWPPTSSLGFAFLSHKVLRWLGPFFILTAYSMLALLTFYYQNLFYTILFLLMNIGLFGVPLLDMFFQKMNLNLVVLRYITYFNAMNLALFKGFFKYLKGVQNGIWQPTKREVES